MCIFVGFFFFNLWVMLMVLFLHSFKILIFDTTKGLDFEHMIKARAHKGGVRIGKTPKKLVSICCP
jgi:hypothetical protein